MAESNRVPITHDVQIAAELGVQATLTGLKRERKPLVSAVVAAGGSWVVQQALGVPGLLPGWVAWIISGAIGAAAYGLTRVQRTVVRRVL